MAAVGFIFPKIDAQSSPIFEISGKPRLVLPQVARVIIRLLEVSVHHVLLRR